MNVTASNEVSASPAASAVAPEFLNIEAATKWSGVGRTVLFGLIREGKIKSINLCRPGCIRGRRLIVIESLRNYLLRHAEGGDNS